MFKLCVALLASTSAALSDLDASYASELGCIRAVPEDISLVEFSLEHSTILSNNLGGQGGKHDIDNDDPEEIRFAQVVTVTREPSVEMTQASSPVARQAAPPATARGAARRRTPARSTATASPTRRAAAWPPPTAVLDPLPDATRRRLDVPLIG